LLAVRNGEEMNDVGRVSNLTKRFLEN
jgi:hypothetical protein